MLSERGLKVARSTKSSSFTIDLAQWVTVMETYESGENAPEAVTPGGLKPMLQTLEP